MLTFSCPSAGSPATRVRRITTNYEIRGLVNQITSYADTAGTTVVNQIQNAYNGFQQLVKQYQQHGAAVNTATSPNVQYAFADGSANTNAPDGDHLPRRRQRHDAPRRIVQLCERQ